MVCTEPAGVDGSTSACRPRCDGSPKATVGQHVALRSGCHPRDPQRRPPWSSEPPQGVNLTWLPRCRPAAARWRPGVGDSAGATGVSSTYCQSAWVARTPPRNSAQRQRWPTTILGNAPSRNRAAPFPVRTSVPCTDSACASWDRVLLGPLGALVQPASAPSCSGAGRCLRPSPDVHSLGCGIAPDQLSSRAIASSAPSTIPLLVSRGHIRRSCTAARGASD